MQQIQDPQSSSHLFSCPLIAFGYYPGVKKAQVRADWVPQTLSSECVCVCVSVSVSVCICIQLVAHLEGMLTVSIMCGKCYLIPKNIYFCFMITPKPLTVFSSVQFSSVTESCLTLCDPMNRSTPGLPVHHQLTEFTQTHVHQVSDAIQPSHPLSSPSPPDPNPSQHQVLFQWVNCSHEVAKVLEFQLQYQSFQ